MIKFKIVALALLIAVTGGLFANSHLNPYLQQTGGSVFECVNEKGCMIYVLSSRTTENASKGHTVVSTRVLECGLNEKLKKCKKHGNYTVLHTAYLTRNGVDKITINGFKAVIDAETLVGLTNKELTIQGKSK